MKNMEIFTSLRFCFKRYKENKWGKFAIEWCLLCDWNEDEHSVHMQDELIKKQDTSQR